MIITKLEAFKNNRKLVYLNDEAAFILYSSDIKALGLKEGAALSDEMYCHIMQEVLPRRCKKRAFNLLEKKDYTCKQLRDKLKEGMYSSEIIDDTIEYMCSYNYLNDYRYAESYARFRQETKNRRMIFVELERKGVAAETISAVLDELYSDSPIDEEEMIRQLARKKLGAVELSEALSAMDNLKIQKLYRYLISKGYDFSKIKHALDIT